MNKSINVVDVIGWDIKNWSMALDFWEKETSLDLSSALALEIGAGNGGLSLWMASKGAHVICSDLNGPTQAARDLHRRHDLQHLIDYQCVDATNIPYTNYFDIVLFKSVLGGIGRNDNRDIQCRTIQEIYKSLKPGGELWFAENLVSTAFHQFCRRRFVKWGAYWRWVSIEEIVDFLKQFSHTSYITAGFLGTLGRSEKQRQLLGTLDQKIFNRLVPDHQKYIIIVAAKK
jgi:SAM-dependent methyltransferase